MSASDEASLNQVFESQELAEALEFGEAMQPLWSEVDARRKPLTAHVTDDYQQLLENARDQTRAIDDERGLRTAAAKHALTNFRRLSDGERNRRRRFALFCDYPRHPCLLFALYVWEPQAGMPPTLPRPTWLGVGYTRTNSHAVLPDWQLASVPDNQVDLQTSINVACRHGTGRVAYDALANTARRGPFTVQSPPLRRSVADLRRVSSLQWTPITPML